MCRTCGVIRTVESDVAFLGTVESKASNPWSVMLLVNGRPVEFKINTGADVTIIPMSVLQSIPDVVLRPPTKTLIVANCKTLCIEGQFTATLKYHDREAAEEVYTVKKLNHPLLGCPAIEALDLVQRVNAVQTETDVVREFPKLLGGLGRLEEEYKIVLRDDARSYALSTPRRIAIPLLPTKVKAELERMEQMGVVSHVHEPTEWCSEMVVVPMADGRVCVFLPVHVVVGGGPNLMGRDWLSHFDIDPEL